MEILIGGKSYNVFTILCSWILPYTIFTYLGVTHLPVFSLWIKLQQQLLTFDVTSVVRKMSN